MDLERKDYFNFRVSSGPGKGLISENKIIALLISVLSQVRHPTPLAPTANAAASVMKALSSSTTVNP